MHDNIKDSIKTVYAYNDNFYFVKRDLSFATDRLTNDRHNLFYVFDKSNNVICLCPLGGHLPSIIFLLRKYYGLVRYTEEDIEKWQQIISDNFVIYNSEIDEPEYYADEIMTGSSVWWSNELEEI